VDAHEILVMEQGRVVERGSHRDLLAQDGRYARMWRLQNESRRPGPSPDTLPGPEESAQDGNPLARGLRQPG